MGLKPIPGADPRPPIPKSWTIMDVIDRDAGRPLWPEGDDLQTRTLHREIERDQRKAWLAALEQEVEYGEAS